MNIKPLTYHDYTSNIVTLQQLIENSYMTNFNLPLNIIETITIDKVRELGDYINSKKAMILGAFIDDILVGFIWFYSHDYYGERRIHINQIIVNKNYRKKGIGKQLLFKAEEIAKNMDIRVMDLFVTEENRSALELYEGMGYITERRYLKKYLGGYRC